MYLYATKQLINHQIDLGCFMKTTKLSYDKKTESIDNLMIFGVNLSQ